MKKYLPYQYNLMREGRKSAAIDLTSASKQITSVTDNQNSPDQKEEEEDEMGPIDCGFIYAMLLITLLPFISSEQVRFFEQK